MRLPIESNLGVCQFVCYAQTPILAKDRGLTYQIDSMCWLLGVIADDEQSNS